MFSLKDFEKNSKNIKNHLFFTEFQMSNNIFDISYENLIKSSTLLLIMKDNLTRKIINEYRRNLDIFIKLLNTRESFELLKKHYKDTEETILVKYRMPFESCLVDRKSVV